MRIQFENFERNPGYDLGQSTGAWLTATVGAGSTFDPDALSSDVGSPPGWGTQCLKVVHATLSNAFNDLVTDGFPTPTRVTRVIAFEAIVTAATLSDGVVVSLMQARDDMLTYWRVLLTQTAGAQQIQFQTRPDGGTLVTMWDEPLVLNKRYRFDVTWDLQNNRWSLRVAGREVARGALSGTAAKIALITAGASGTSSNVYTAYIDRIEVDDSTAIDDRSTRSLAGSQRAT